MAEDKVVRRIRHMCQVIESLGQELQEARAENKRLREALRNFRYFYGSSPKDGCTCPICQSMRDVDAILKGPADE